MRAPPPFVAAMALLIGLGACELPGRNYGIHRVRVDSLITPDTLAPGQSLRVRVKGSVGPTSCDTFDHVERYRSETGVTLVLWARRRYADDCTASPVPLDTTFVEAPPFADSFHVVVQGTAEHGRIVLVGPGAASTIQVFFHAAEDSVVAVARRGRAPQKLAGALRMELRGPTEGERARGLYSWFSPATAALLLSASVSDGHAVVDFGKLNQAIPGASSAAGSRELLQELNRVVFQFPEIQSVEYRIEGSCDAFWNWLQMACQRVRRPPAPRRPGAVS
ncbi:MAG: GerMN domain-containing protein [Gemmatimonadota bacterium]